MTLRRQLVQPGWAAVLIACLGVSVGLCGCVTDLEPGQEPLRARPKPVAGPPEYVPAESIALFAKSFSVDSDNSGRGDTIEATVYLWSSEYQVPIHDRGIMAFALFEEGAFATGDAAPIAHWSLEPDEVDEHRARQLPGLCYLVKLPHRVTTVGGEEVLMDFTRNEGDLVAWFTSDATGQTVMSGRATIQLGQPFAR